MNYRILSFIISLPLLPLVLTSASAQQPTAQPDTLQRELVLEREFIPQSEQVRKAYFNPLAVPDRKQPLHPLDFAKTTYTVGMNISPNLFSPVYVDHAPDFGSQKWYARLHGGFPGRVGIHTGWHFNTSDLGTLDLAIDHESLFTDIPQKIEGHNLNVTARDQQHTTGVTARYTHRLQEGMLSILGRVYYDLNTLYGHAPTDYTVPLSPDPLKSSYPLFGIRGGAVRITKSKAPLLFSSTLQYEAFARASYASMDSYKYPSPPVGESDDYKQYSQIGLSAGASIFMGLSGSWQAGADVSAEYQLMPQMHKFNTNGNPTILSGTPFLEYNGEGLYAKIGAKLQYLNRGKSGFVVAPKADIRLQAGRQFSIIAQADGGGRLFDLRDTYLTNRYTNASSIYYAQEVATFDLRGGFEAGPFDGLSFRLLAGFTSYSHFTNWFLSTVEQELNGKSFSMRTFNMSPYEGINKAYFRASALLISPLGLELNASLSYNQYSSKERESDQVVQSTVYGLPNTELTLSGRYPLTSQLTLLADFTGIGGIKFVEPVYGGTPTVYKLPFIADLNAGVAYRISDKVGLSLRGTNLLNRANQRWLNYTKPGIGVIGALSVTL